MLKIAPGLQMPLEAVTETFGILAIRGGGKSNTAAVMAEAFFDAELPFVVVDPVGSWYGLRSSRDGKRPGLPVAIFGGRHGDVPLEANGGETLADLVVEERLSCVLDVSEFSEGEKHRFLLGFGDRLYRKNTDPLHLFLEEADDYAPQKPMREQARLLRVWQNIVRRGRARGLGITMITQRSAVLNKDVLTQIGTLIVLRSTSPQDRKAIQGWVEYYAQERELLESLPHLANGEAWIWSPSFLKTCKRVQLPLRRTFDSGATPKARKKNRAPATLADIDLEAVRERMADTIERAKADDPKELRKRIAQLERELKAKKPAEAPPPKTVEVPVVKPAELRRVEQLADRVEKLTARAEKLAGDATAAVGSFSESVEALLADVKRRAETGVSLEGALRSSRGAAKPAVAAAILAPRKAPPPSRGERPSTGEGAELTAYERRLLQAFAARHPLELTVAQVSTLSGYSRKSSSFAEAMKNLRHKGLVEPGRTGERITDAGFFSLGDAAPEIPSTPEARIALWRSKLNQSEGRIFDAIVRAYPEALSVEEISEVTGYSRTSSSFSGAISSLKKAELVVALNAGTLQACETLFE